MSTAANPPAKLLGSALEPFDGSSSKADAFWTSLTNYYYLNTDVYPLEDKRITSALTHFKLRTPAGEWAKDHQEAALAASPVDFGTWKAFKDAFKAHFIPVESVMNSTNVMHTLKMNNRPFSDWYQEWSTHTSRSSANKTTKMYAFRQNILSALNNKILGMSPTPTTMAHLVELTKEFDQSWRTYNTAQSQRRCSNLRFLAPEPEDPASVALTNFPPKDGKKFKKLTNEERERRKSEGRCMYYSQKGHWQDKCQVKFENRKRFGNRNHNQPPRTRGTEVDDLEPNDLVPNNNDPALSISRIYPVPEHHFDLSHPDPDFLEQDF